jgi:hypothetical protein
VLFGAFVVVGLEGAVEIAILAVEFLVSVFGVTVFAEFGALAASAGERDHELSLSVRMWTLPLSVLLVG